jgi:predicted dehydrogenase
MSMGLRVIQVGLGGWGRDWAKEVTGRVAGVEPVAWVDLDPAARRSALAELDLPEGRVFASLADAAAAVAAEAAIVVVPLAGHVAASAEALERGLHVLVEKPFAPTLAEARDLIALARRRRLALLVSQNYRWLAAPRLARTLLREGAIGELRGVHLDFHHFYGSGYRYFFLDQPLLGDMAIHHFDALRFVLDDEPLEVSCTSWGEPGMPFKGPPAATATIRFAKGAVVGYWGSWISRGPATPWSGEWRLDGTKGRIDLAWRGSAARRETLERLELHGAGPTPKLPAMPLKDRRGALHAFAAWARDGTPPEGASTAEDNLGSLALMHAAIRSSQQGGGWVRVADVLAEGGA